MATSTATSLSIATSDRRTHARMATSVAIRYGKDQEFVQGELLDVSAGGIGIKGETTYAVGTELELRFRARAAEKDLITLRAVVRHSVPSKRMGLEFVNLPASDVGRTLGMIERLAAAQQPAPASK